MKLSHCSPHRREPPAMAPSGASRGDTGGVSPVLVRMSLSHILGTLEPWANQDTNSPGSPPNPQFSQRKFASVPFLGAEAPMAFRLLTFLPSEGNLTSAGQRLSPPRGKNVLESAGARGRAHSRMARGPEVCTPSPPQSPRRRRTILERGVLAHAFLLTRRSLP